MLKYEKILTILTKGNECVSVVNYAFFRERESAAESSLKVR
mgnify:FL=1